MNVSPLDLRQQKFKSAMRGYERGEVDALLTAVADDYEGAIREAAKRAKVKPVKPGPKAAGASAAKKRVVPPKPRRRPVTRLKSGKKRKGR